MGRAAVAVVGNSRRGVWGDFDLVYVYAQAPAG